MALTRTPAGCGLGDLSEVVANPTVREEVRDKFGPILNAYEMMLDLPITEIRHYLTKQCFLVNSQDVNLFLEMTKSHSMHLHYNGYEGYTGLFASKLMMNAILGGYTKFSLNMSELPPLQKIGDSLAVPAENKLDITVHGTFGYWCFYNLHAAGTIKIDNAQQSLLRDSIFDGDIIIGSAGELSFLNTHVRALYTPSNNLYVRLVKQQKERMFHGELHLISHREFDTRMKE